MQMQKNQKNKMQEEFEENKGVIKICRPKKDRQHNDQKTEGQTTQ